MALISFGTIVTDARGKVGGSVFSRNQAGNVIRNKSIPKRRTTDIKSRYNNVWQYYSQLWLTLSPSEQADWENYATNFTFHNKLGAAVAAQGNIVFAVCSYYNALALKSPFSGAPTYAAPAAVDNIVVTSQLSDQPFYLNFDALAADVNLRLYASPWYRQGKRAFMEKRVNSILFSTLVATNDALDWGAQYIARYGTPPVGSYILLAIRRIHPDSQAWSSLQYIETEVIA